MKAINGSIECPKCGSSHKAKCFYIFENGYYCFSCGFSKSSDRSFSFREIRAHNPDFPELTEFTNNTNKFSIIVLKWLAQFHITLESMKKHNILYCEDDSLIYQNIQDGKVIGYQRRWLGGERKIITKGPKSPFLIPGNQTKPNQIVLVEDYLSAIRVHNSDNASVVCLWGTKIEYSYLKELFNEYEKCLVWLDNDTTKQTNSGQEAANKICKMAENIIYYKNRHRYTHDQTVINIATDLDPKYYSDSEIKQIIKGALVNEFRPLPHK